ncbi:bssS family protein [Salmonella enterica subsp. diarizonae]|nr:bssS family protein [Salmonella enterica subsp. diarizonae]
MSSVPPAVRPFRREIPIFPVTGWKSGPLQSGDCLVLKFEYITSPMQSLESAQSTQFFGLTPQIAESLIADLQKSINSLKSDGNAPRQAEKH